MNTNKNLLIHLLNKYNTNISWGIRLLTFPRNSHYQINGYNKTKKIYSNSHLFCQFTIRTVGFWEDNHFITGNQLFHFGGFCCRHIYWFRPKRLKLAGEKPYDTHKTPMDPMSKILFPELCFIFNFWEKVSAMTKQEKKDVYLPWLRSYTGLFQGKLLLTTTNLKSRAINFILKLLLKKRQSQKLLEFVTFNFHLMTTTTWQGNAKPRYMCS